jgi:hypothetical protein
MNQAFIEMLTPIFQKYGVPLYINGHDHHYERSQSLKGTTYLICGAGAGLDLWEISSSGVCCGQVEFCCV